MPTWSIFHAAALEGARSPYLARHFRVVTFDGRGNGRSDRPADRAAYADTEFVADAVAVLDATGTDAAFVAGLSMGAGYAMRLARDHPERVLRPDPVRRHRSPCARSAAPAETAPTRNDSFEDPQPTDEGWAKYNVHYWRRDWPGFAEWFAPSASSPSRTRPSRSRTRSAGPSRPTPRRSSRPSAPRTSSRRHGWTPDDPTHGPGWAFAAPVRCPALVVNGTDDRLTSIATGPRPGDGAGGADRRGRGRRPRHDRPRPGPRQPADPGVRRRTGGGT